MSVKILTGDALKQLQSLPDCSVQCVVTSPPYWGLRAYHGDPGMIGLEPTFDAHLENLVAVFREVRRVLRKDGTLWLNYGDAYAASTKGSGGKKAYSAAKVSKGAFMDKPFAMDHGLKPKDLMMMPARMAMALQADGWWLRSEIIWRKPNLMPESCRDRPTSAHEKIYLLSKSARYFYDAEAVRTNQKESSIERDRYGRENSNTSWGNSTGYHGNNPSEKRRPDKQRGHTRPHEGFQNDWDGRTKEDQQASGANLRNVWKISAFSFSGAHFATFPPELVDKCVKAGTSEKGCCSKCGMPWVRDVERKPGVYQDCPKTAKSQVARGDRGAGNVGKTEVEPPSFITIGWSPACQCEAAIKPCVVLDPFGGSGTVGLVCDRLGRDVLLIEISPEYCEMARERIRRDCPFTEIQSFKRGELMGQHARLSASQSSRWLKCPGSILAVAAVPKKDSPAANEGTYAHELAAEQLNHGNELIVKSLFKDPDEAKRSILNYVQYVKKYWGKEDDLYVEVKLYYETIVKDGFGTSDAIIINRQQKTCHIFDFKFGRTRISAKKNSQLRFYAAGAAEQYSLKGYKFVLHIVQPRVSNYDVEFLDFKELSEWVKNTAIPGAQRASEKDPPRIAGSEQCLWCEAKNTCPEFTTFMNTEVVSQFDGSKTMSQNISTERMIHLLHIKNIVVTYFEDMEAHVLNEMKNGSKEFDQHFKLVEGRTNRQWNSHAARELKRVLNVKAYVTKLINITEAKKLLPTEEQYLLRDFTVKPIGKPCLVSIDDPRASMDQKITDQFEEIL